VNREPAVEIRTLHTIEEFEQTVGVQREVWGFSDRDLVPPRLFAVAAHIGGLVLGAYEGGALVGFSLTFPGLHSGPRRRTRHFWHSHMTGVLPSHQHRRIGRQLKLRQRQEGLAAGVDLVEWTFDPLEIRNAYFNIEKLGVIVRRYVPNQYGVTSSRLHGSLPTDRLVAEWYLNGPRARAAAGRGEQLDKQTLARIEVPGEIEELRSRDPEKAREIQARVREEFEKRFAEGLAVAGFRRAGAGGAYELGLLAEQPVAVVSPGESLE